MKRVALLLTLSLAASCQEWKTITPAPSRTCENAPDPHCAHPLGQVLVPMYRGAGLPILDAQPLELCRRMAVDLVGRIPTEAERAACATQTPEQMADAFMALPAYERNERLRFAELLQNDAFLSWYGYLSEMDALVGRHARGEIRYHELIGRLGANPGFYARNPGEDWTRALVRLAFGRAARADEQAQLKPLAQAWANPRTFDDGAIFWNWRLIDTVSADDDVGQATSRAEYTFNLCACAPAAGFPGCRSTGLGKLVDFGFVCPNPADTSAFENNLRLTGATPGRLAVCPDGSTRAACADRLVTSFDGQRIYFGDPVLPYAQLGGAVPDPGRALADALAERGDLWETAADRELRRLLGWWQSGFRRPDWDLPRVRQVVADELKRTGSLRAAQRLILTSLLYIAPAEVADPNAPEPPVWALGPTKLMPPEAWLDSVAQLAGEQAGVCDFRFVASIAAGTGTETEATRLEPFTSTLPSFTRDQYEAWAQALGGCSANQARPTISSVGTLSAQHAIATMTCAVGREVLPADFHPDDRSDAALDAITTRLYQRGLARAPAPEELAAMRDEMRACLAEAPETACADVEAAARWACLRLSESAAFGTY